MKKTIRVFCLVLALCMALSLGAFASGEASGEASGGASDMMPPDGIIKESPPDVEALVPTVGNINVDGSTEPSEYATNNNFRRDDTGFITIGYDIVDGRLTDNSNWTTDDPEHIALTQQVTGAGFTAVRLSGEESKTTITGNLMLTDSQSDNDGTHASDFSAVGAAVSAVNGSEVTLDGVNMVTYGFVRAGLILDNNCIGFIKDSTIRTFGNDPFTKA